MNSGDMRRKEENKAKMVEAFRKGMKAVSGYLTDSEYDRLFKEVEKACSIAANAIHHGK